VAPVSALLTCFAVAIPCVATAPLGTLLCRRWLAVFVVVVTAAPEAASGPAGELESRKSYNSSSSNLFAAASTSVEAVLGGGLIRLSNASRLFLEFARRVEIDPLDDIGLAPTSMLSPSDNDSKLEDREGEDAR